MLLNEITQPSDMRQLQHRLKNWSSWLVQGSHTPEDITDALQDEISDVAIVSMKRSPNVDKGDMSASAYYEPEADEEGDIPFEIELYFSNKDDQIVINNPDPLVNRVMDMLKHEMLHQKQYHSRDFIEPPEGKDRRDSNYEYMSRTDEIEAYAMNIADELVRAAGKDGALQLLRIANKTAQFKNELGQFLSPDLFAYMSMWNFDSKHPILKRLLKKIYQFIVH